MKHSKANEGKPLKTICLCDYCKHDWPGCGVKFRGDVLLSGDLVGKFFDRWTFDVFASVEKYLHGNVIACSGFESRNEEEQGKENNSAHH